MIDIKFIEEFPEIVRKNILRRNSHGDVDLVLEGYTKFKKTKSDLDKYRRQRNEISKKFVNTDKGTKETLLEKMKSIKEEITLLEERLRIENDFFLSEMKKIPNLTAESVPEGKTDEENIPLEYYGKPTHKNFLLKNHVELGIDLDLLDFDTGTKISGKKFPFIKGKLVRLERALVDMALDMAEKNGFKVMTTPELAKNEIIESSGFNPRGPETQIYSIDNSDLSLIGTSEITLGGYYTDTCFQKEKLPIKLAAITNCYRTEAGSSGKKSLGLYRVHQFKKVELYVISTIEQSENIHESLLRMEIEFYKSLEIPFRVMNMCAGDLGAPAYKKYDLEAWMPFLIDEGGYGEITSTSNCTDFQSRRLNIKYEDQGERKFVHTLNGTAIATTRVILAIMENFQNKDGTISIPKELQKYTGFSLID